MSTLTASYVVSSSTVFSNHMQMHKRLISTCCKADVLGIDLIELLLDSLKSLDSQSDLHLFLAYSCHLQVAHEFTMYIIGRRPGKFFSSFLKISHQPSILATMWVEYNPLKPIS